MATKTCAMTTAVVVKEICTSMTLRVRPSRPRLPSVASRAIPATTGGMVIGSTASTRPTRTPRHCRASRSANGTPRQTEITVAMTQVRSDRPRARVAACDVSSVGSSVQATRVPSPTKGRTMAQAPSTPSASTGSGSGEWAARDRPRRLPEREADPGSVAAPGSAGRVEARSVTSSNLSHHVGRRPNGTPAQAGVNSVEIWRIRGGRVQCGRPLGAAECAAGRQLDLPDSADSAGSVASVDSFIAGLVAAAESAGAPNL